MNDLSNGACRILSQHYNRARHYFQGARNKCGKQESEKAIRTLLLNVLLQHRFCQIGVSYYLACFRIPARGLVASKCTTG